MGSRDDDDGFINTDCYWNAKLRLVVQQKSIFLPVKMLFLYPDVQHMFLKEGNIHTLYHFINNWGCCCLRIRTLRSIHIAVIVKVRIQPVVHFEVRLLGDFVLGCRHAQACVHCVIEISSDKAKEKSDVLFGYMFVCVSSNLFFIGISICVYFQ